MPRRPGSSTNWNAASAARATGSSWKGLRQAAAQLYVVGQPQGPAGKNVFEGGFGGLDNIGVFDRSSQSPTVGRLDQAVPSAWMALFAQNMLSIALELAKEDPSTASAAPGRSACLKARQR